MTNQELHLEFWRCESDRRIELHFTEEAFQILKDILEHDAGIKVIAKELPAPVVHYGVGARHRWIEILTAIHEVQGLKLEEGMDVVPAIESLLNKYISLKQGI